MNKIIDRHWLGVPELCFSQVCDECLKAWEIKSMGRIVYYGLTLNKILYEPFHYLLQMLGSVRQLLHTFFRRRRWHSCRRRPTSWRRRRRTFPDPANSTDARTFRSVRTRSGCRPRSSCVWLVDQPDAWEYPGWKYLFVKMSWWWL